MAPGDKNETVPWPIEQLKLDDGYLNSMVMRALEQMGPAAKDAIPAVIATMAEDRWAAPMLSLSVVAADTLKAIGPDAIPLLIKALDGDAKRLRFGALNALRQFGPEAKAAVPSVLRLLKSEDADLARNAGLTLKRIDPEAAKKAGVK